MVLDALQTSSSIFENAARYISKDQCHIRMCHRAVAWTSDVAYVCSVGLRDG